MAGKRPNGGYNPDTSHSPGPLHAKAKQTLGETASPNAAPARFTKTSASTAEIRPGQALPASNDTNGLSVGPKNNKDAGGRQHY